MRIFPWIYLLVVVVVIVPVHLRGEVPNHAVVLIYHHVGSETPASTSLPTALFEEHLDYLAENGYRVLPLVALTDSLKYGGVIPDRAVALTFDDGYTSVFTEAFPRLRERGWPFTVFVCPDAVDHSRGPVMTWSQLREMAAAGATVANHGMFHQHLQRRGEGESDQDWSRRIRGELLAAQQRISEEMGSAPGIFAFPFGEYDQSLRELIGELGWAAFGQQSGPMGESSDFTLLPRFPMAGPFAGMDSFGEKVASLPLPVAAVVPVEPGITILQEGPGPRPVLRVTLRPGDYLRQGAAVYAGGQGAADLEWIDEQVGILEVQARQPLSPGRNRYNITAPATDGLRYYWYSHTWIVGQLHKD